MTDDPITPHQPEPAEIQAALQAFLDADDWQEMEAVVSSYPIVDSEAFERAVARLAEHASVLGDPEATLRLQSRLDLLFDVKAYRTMTPLERAIDAYVNAVDDEEAEEVFADESERLTSPEALQALARLEAGDPETQLFLQERLELLRRLREDHAQGA